MKNNYKKLVVALLILLSLEAIGFVIWYNDESEKIKEKYEKDLQISLLKKEQEKKEIIDKFEENKYLASGANIYERIYNRDGQSIIQMLSELSKESFPDGWGLEIKAEEFTNFILLAQFVENEQLPEVQEVAKFLMPIAQYGGEYLKNVAIYNKKRNCVYFFSEEQLQEFLETGKLKDLSVVAIKKNGREFTRYNSTKIPFKKHEGHIFIQATITGNAGVEDCIMMLDTGASMTVISLEMAQKTGNEDLNLVPKKSFSTAKGLLRCPITKREISIDGVDVEGQVAVNIEDDANLLGINFFEGKDYLIDAKTDTIYIWQR